MKVHKAKRNSLKRSSKPITNQPNKQNEKTNFKTISKHTDIEPKNKTQINSKIDSNINNSIKKLQKSKDENSLTYIKSLPSHIAKKQFFITPSKNENQTQDSIKVNKNEEILSAINQTKEKKE